MSFASRRFGFASASSLEPQLRAFVEALPRANASVSGSDPVLYARARFALADGDYNTTKALIAGKAPNSCKS